MMPGIGFLFTALGFVRKAAQAAFDFIREKPALAAIIALCVLSAWLWRGWDRADAETAVQVAGRAADRKAVGEAQVEAARLALAEKRAKETAATQSKDQANAALKPSLAAGQTATDRYAREHRCLRVTPAESGRVHADLSGAIPLAGQPAQPAEQADVAVTERDLSVCTSAVLTLDNAYAWGQDMVARGLAR